MATTDVQDWIRRRADEVRSQYSAFQCMQEHGHGEMLVDEETPVQVFCPLHSNVNTPAARYYPAVGGRSDYVRCYRCKENWDSPNLYARLNGLSFMESLQRLERRFRIKVPRRPEAPEIQEPKDKSSPDYSSPAWQDVPRVLAVLEKKLLRIRDEVPLQDYVKFCRVLDGVQWDLDHKLRAEDQMASSLSRLRAMMDESRGGLPDAPGRV